MATPGNWSVLGYSLPDYGITEALFGPKWGNTGSIPTTGPNAPLQYDNPINNALQQDIKSAGPNATPAYNNLSAAIKPPTSSPPPSPPPSGGGNPPPKITNLDDYTTIDGVRKTYRSAMAEGLIDEYGNIRTNSVPQGPSDADINALYEPSQNYLNQYEGYLRGQLPSVLEAAQGQYNTAKSILEGNKSNSYATLESQKGAAQGRREDADAASRRLYNELQTANQQRFGGSTSAGEAAQALQGRELQRNMGQNQRQMEDFNRQYNASKLEIDNVYQSGLLQLEQQKQAAVNQANSEFQAKLLEISKTRAGLEQEKAAKRLDALQTYRNQIFQIQMQNAQFQQALEGQRQQATLQLETSAKQFNQANVLGQNSLMNLLAGTSVNPQTQFGVFPIGGNQGQSQYTGAISTRRDEQLQGQTGGVYPVAQLVDGRYRYSDGSVR